MSPPFCHLHHGYSDWYQQNLTLLCWLEEEHVTSWRHLHFHSMEGVYVAGAKPSISPPAQLHKILMGHGSVEQGIEMFPFCILPLLMCCGYTGCGIVRAFHTTSSAWNCKTHQCFNSWLLGQGLCFASYSLCQSILRTALLPFSLSFILPP